MNRVCLTKYKIHRTPDRALPAGPLYQCIACGTVFNQPEGFGGIVSQTMAFVSCRCYGGARWDLRQPIRRSDR